MTTSVTKWTGSGLRVPGLAESAMNEGQEVQPSPPELSLARAPVERTAPGQGCARWIAVPTEKLVAAQQRA